MRFADILRPSCALFFDFDGTLVDLAPRPEDVHVPPELHALLRTLQTYLGGAVAVISGRPIAQIDGFFSPLQLPTAGVHGTERRDAQGRISLLNTHALDRVLEATQALVAQYPALRVEHKRGSIALHFRQAPELASLCEDAMRTAVAESPGLTLLQGKMVLEAKPDGATKGRAIEAFLQEAPFSGRTPVFIGDDFTDEVGFCAVQARGGMGIKVGAGTTVAKQRLDSPVTLRRELADALRERAERAASS
jgi:trehalose 6-phosphate phosphatase